MSYDVGDVVNTCATRCVEQGARVNVCGDRDYSIVCEIVESYNFAIAKTRSFDHIYYVYFKLVS